MTRVRLDLFVSLDGFTSATEQSAENPMGEDWGRLTANYAATRTFNKLVFNDTSGAGTTGVDDAYASAFFDGIGAEIMGAGMFGQHSFPNDPQWQGWWGARPPFRCPVYVLSSSAPRPMIPRKSGTTFHFRNSAIEDVPAEATEAAGGLDVRIGGGVGTARSYLRAGLVDDLHFMVGPIILGQGTRLWDGLDGLEVTHHVRTEVAESGTIHVTFRRKDAR